MVPGRHCHDTPFARGRIECQKLVQRAACLERSGFLEVLALEKERHAGFVAEKGCTCDGRHMKLVRKAGASGADLF
jgi:hypothetical protein